MTTPIAQTLHILGHSPEGVRKGAIGLGLIINSVAAAALFYTQMGREDRYDPSACLIFTGKGLLCICAQQAITKLGVSVSARMSALLLPK